jgi:hypothetical protein
MGTYHLTGGGLGRLISRDDSSRGMDAPSARAASLASSAALPVPARPTAVRAVTPTFDRYADPYARQSRTPLVLQPHLLFTSLVVCAAGAGLVAAPPS